jgi:hypothetical protein
MQEFFWGTYWKLYRLVYERATDDKIKGQTNRGMHKVLDNHMRRNNPFGERKEITANNPILGAPKAREESMA